MILLTASSCKAQKEMVITMDKAKTSAVDMQILPDCMALTENGGCSLLKNNQCSGAGCCFVHTAEDNISAAAHWKKRLLSLSDEEQTKISKKYYGGLMPWR